MFLGDSWEGAGWWRGWHAGALTWAHALSHKYAEPAVGISQNTQTVHHWGWGGGVAVARRGCRMALYYQINDSVQQQFQANSGLGNILMESA